MSGAPIAMLVWTRAMIARLEGKPVTDCPHDGEDLRGRALAQIWRAGWTDGPDEMSPVKHRTRLGAGWARKLVASPIGKGVGRGRSKLGERHEWSALELEILALARAACWRADRVALVLGRTPQAVRNQIDRVKKAERAAA